MKKMIIVLFSLVLIFPISAIAEITVLEGEESNNGYEIDGSGWEKLKDSQKLFLVIDANLGTPHFDVNDVVVISYWKEWQGGQKFKYYERRNLIVDLSADIQIADLGKINDKRKVAFCISAFLIESKVEVEILGHLIGERNKKGYIKYLKGNFLSHTYNDIGGEITAYEKSRWEIDRTKDFTGPSAEEIADRIVGYLESKGYVALP